MLSALWTKVVHACNTLGITAEESMALWNVLAAIIHLGAAGAVKGRPKNNDNNNMQILIKRRKHPTDTQMLCCLLLWYQESCHNHFTSSRMCYWSSAHPIST